MTTSVAIATAVWQPELPAARGPLTAALFGALREPPHELSLSSSANGDYGDEDATLALYVLYELHYRSFTSVSDGWEWEPSLLRLRAALEAAFESQLIDLVGGAPARYEGHDVVAELRALAADDRGPSLSSYLATRGSLEEMREFAVHRSAYQLKEADPHTWVIPRLAGRAKAAVADIQHGEYGDGVAGAGHAELFAGTLRALGLDAAYGAYLDRVPGTTLATVNLMSLFGLHRRWRGALVGHLAMFEMCSVVPMGRYRDALRRFGLPEATRFYDEHVVADERHAVVALHDLAGALAADEPALARDIVFGARALQATEARFARSVLDAWAQGRTSLLGRR
jgi:heme oxygenase-like protein